MKRKIARYIVEWIAFDLVTSFLFFLYHDWIWSILSAILIYFVYRTIVISAVGKLNTISINRTLMNRWTSRLFEQLVVTPSLHDAIIALRSDHAFADILALENNENITDIQSLESLVYRFNRPHYTLFHSLLSNIDQCGSDFHSIASSLVLSINRDFNDHLQHMEVLTDQLKNLLIGWAFTFTVILYMRIVLSDFYLEQTSVGMLRYGIAGVILLFTLSIYQFFKSYLPLNDESGWNQ